MPLTFLRKSTSNNGGKGGILADIASEFSWALVIGSTRLIESPSLPKIGCHRKKRQSSGLRFDFTS